MPGPMPGLILVLALVLERALVLGSGMVWTV
jgi:hypothetical protein